MWEDRWIVMEKGDDYGMIKLLLKSDGCVEEIARY